MEVELQRVGESGADRTNRGGWRAAACGLFVIALAAGPALAQDSPMPPGAGAKVDLALLEPAPAELIRASIAEWSVAPSDRERANALIDAWWQGEAQAERREFSSLRQAESALVSFARRPGGWRGDPSGVDLYVRTVRDRVRANERRRAREDELLAELAAALHRPDGDVGWISARLVAWHAAHVPAPVGGAQFDLGEMLVPGQGVLPSDNLGEAVRNHWIGMKPLWQAKLASRDAQLRASADLALGTASIAEMHDRNRRYLDACRAVVMGNLAWTATFLAAGDDSASCDRRLEQLGEWRSACIVAPPPCVPVGRDCASYSAVALTCLQLRQMSEDVLQIAWLGSLQSIYVRSAGRAPPLGDDAPRVWASRDACLEHLRVFHAAVQAAGSPECLEERESAEGDR